MTDKEAAAICSAIGHNPLGILILTPEKVRFECSCGYVSRNRRNVKLAVEAGIVHMRGVARHAFANSGNLPPPLQVAV